MPCHVKSCNSIIVTVVMSAKKARLETDLSEKIYLPYVVAYVQLPGTFFFKRQHKIEKYIIKIVE